MHMNLLPNGTILIWKIDIYIKASAHINKKHRMCTSQLLRGAQEALRGLLIQRPSPNMLSPPTITSVKTLSGILILIND